MPNDALSPLSPAHTTHPHNTQNTITHRTFVACDPKVLRVALSSFYDMLAVTLRTLREFDEDEEE